MFSTEPPAQEEGLHEQLIGYQSIATPRQAASPNHIQAQGTTNLVRSGTTYPELEGRDHGEYSICLDSLRQLKVLGLGLAKYPTVPGGWSEVFYGVPDAQVPACLPTFPSAQR